MNFQIICEGKPLKNPGYSGQIDSGAIPIRASGKDFIVTVFCTVYQGAAVPADVPQKVLQIELLINGKRVESAAGPALGTDPNRKVPLFSQSLVKAKEFPGRDLEFAVKYFPGNTWTHANEYDFLTAYCLE